MKKFLSAILSFAMIFALSIPAFAADITVAPTETVTNEYQSMLELQKISIAFFSSRISFTIISTAPTIRPASTIIPA